MVQAKSLYSTIYNNYDIYDNYIYDNYDVYDNICFQMNPLITEVHFSAY